jgi:hypothetical protein
VNATTPKTELMKAAGKKSTPWGRGYFVCANSMYTRGPRGVCKA